MFTSLFEIKMSIEARSKYDLSYYAYDLYVLDEIIRDNIETIHPMLVKKMVENTRASQSKRLETKEMKEKYSEEQIPFVDFGESRKKTGAKGFDPIVRFKCCLGRHYFGVSYVGMHELVKNHIGLRLFLGIGEEDKIPSKSTLQLRESEFDDEFLHEINEKFLLPIAKKEKIVVGEKVRGDSTVIEENITYPTDAKLLYKGIAMIKNMANKVSSFFGTSVQKVITKLEVTTREMKLSLLDIVKYAHGRTNDAKVSFKKTYEKMILLAKTYEKEALALADMLERSLEKKIKATIPPNDPFAKPRSSKISSQEKRSIMKRILGIRSVCEKLHRVIEQTKRRVIDEEKVPMCEKLLSYCSDTVAIIQKGKEGKQSEFGRKLMITEAEHRFVVQWNVPPGNPNDITLLIPSFEETVRVLGKPPKKSSYDRGFRDEDAINKLTEKYGTKMAIPKKGKKNKEEKKREKQKRFTKMQAWRAGGEAQINCLKRDCDLKSSRVRGDEPMKRHIGFGILINNCIVLTKHLKTKYQKKWVRKSKGSYIHL